MGEIGSHYSLFPLGATKKHDKMNENILQEGRLHEPYYTVPPLWPLTMAGTAIGKHMQQQASDELLVVKAIPFILLPSLLPFHMKAV